MGVVTGGDDRAVSSATFDTLYLTDVLLLCVECRAPIKARINTPGWIKVEWIGPAGQCKGCHDRTKEQRDGKEINYGST